MEGAVELAEEIFHIPVRIGMPQHISGLSDVVRNPIYATGVGLLLFGQRQVQNNGSTVRLDGGVKGILQRMKSWFHGNF